MTTEANPGSEPLGGGQRNPRGPGGRILAQTGVWTPDREWVWHAAAEAGGFGWAARLGWAALVLSVLILMLGTGSARAAGGALVTSEGGTYKGEIRWLDGAFSVAGVTVGLERLASVRFDAAASAAATNAAATNLAKYARTVIRGGPGGGFVRERRVLPIGLQLTNGSVILRPVSSVDERGVCFLGAEREPVLSLSNLACIFVQPPSPETLARVPPGRAGLLFTNDQFFEGDFKFLRLGKVKTVSLLFGALSSDLKEVAAVILREAKPAPARFEIRTATGSRILADLFRIEKERLVFQDASLDGLKIPAAELSEIRRWE